ADAGQPGPAQNGDWRRAPSASRRRAWLARPSLSLLAMGPRLHRRRGVAAMVPARRRRAPSVQLADRPDDRRRPADRRRAPAATRGDDQLDRRRMTGLLAGLIGVALLVGLNVSFKDLGAVAEV